MGRGCERPGPLWFDWAAKHAGPSRAPDGGPGAPFRGRGSPA